MQLDTTIQLPVASTVTVSTHFFGQPAGHGPVHKDGYHAVIIPQVKAGGNRTAFCNYLTSEAETVEDCQTFRNEALKILSSIHNKADDKKPQPQQ